MKNNTGGVRGALAPLLFVLVAGCSSSAIVGTETGSLPEGLCEGSCPDFAYAAAITAGYSMIQDMAASADGGVVLAGSFAGELATGGAPLVQSDYSGNDSYLMKRAADGSLAWVKQIKGNVASARVVVRGGDETVLVGSYQDTADLGSGDLTAPADQEMFFTTVSAAGVVAAPLRFGIDAYVTGMVQLESGSLLVTAVTLAPVTVAGAALAYQESFLLGLSPAGDILFARGAGGSGASSIDGIAARPGGGATLIGKLSGPLAWDGATIAEPSANDSYVLAVGDDGTGEWASRLDPTPLDATDSKAAVAVSVATTASGDSLVALSLVAAAESRAIAFQSFDSAGNRLAHVAVGVASNAPWQMIVAGDGDVLFVGASYGDLTIAGAETSSPADTDAYVARLSPSGELRWLRTLGAPSSIQQAIHVVIGSNGAPIIGGEYQGSFAIDDETMPPAPLNPNAFVAELSP